MDGRFSFHSADAFPPPREFSGRTKTYATKGVGSFIDWEAPERWKSMWYD